MKYAVLLALVACGGKEQTTTNRPSSHIETLHECTVDYSDVAIVINCPGSDTVVVARDTSCPPQEDNIIYVQPTIDIDLPDIYTEEVLEEVETPIASVPTLVLTPTPVIVIPTVEPTLAPTPVIVVTPKPKPTKKPRKTSYADGRFL